MNQSYDQAQKDVSSKCKECEILIDAMFFRCKSLYSVSVANRNKKLVINSLRYNLY
jgi:hypothetical protein